MWRRSRIKTDLYSFIQNPIDNVFDFILIKLFKCKNEFDRSSKNNGWCFLSAMPKGV